MNRNILRPGVGRMPEQRIFAGSLALVRKRSD